MILSILELRQFHFLNLKIDPFKFLDMMSNFLQPGVNNALELLS